MFDDEERKQAAGLTPMEIMGALTIRLIHDLTNHLTILAGNAQVLEMVRDNTQRLDKVIERIKASSTAAGELLRDLATLNPMPGGWLARMPAEIDGRVALEPRWIAFAIWQVALRSEVSAGRVQLSVGDFPADWQGAGHVPSRLKEGPLLRCELSWESPGPWLDEREAVKPMDLHLAVVYELIKVVDGWVHYRFQPPDQHRFNLFVPLAS